MATKVEQKDTGFVQLGLFDRIEQEYYQAGLNCNKFVDDIMYNFEVLGYDKDYRIYPDNLTPLILNAVFDSEAMQELTGKRNPVENINQCVYVIIHIEGDDFPWDRKMMESAIGLMDQLVQKHNGVMIESTDLINDDNNSESNSIISAHPTFVFGVQKEE